MALDATVIFACSVVLYGICAQTEIPSTCNDPLTPSLRDDQFTASSKYDEQHGASFARFNSSVGWIAGSNNNEYLKVSLDGVWRITALDFADSNFRWPLNYLRVSYSLDGYQWDAYNTRLSRDSLGKKFPRQGSVTKLTLDPPIEVRYLAFYGASAYGYPSIRLELYGCQISATPFSGKVTQVTDDIQADTTWIPSQNPFVISRQVNVRPEVTLTVQAGVNVIFTSKTARLDIFGTLVSEGLPEIRTHFSSDIPMMETSSLWLGIKQFSGGNVTLRHTTVRQAVVGIQGNGSNIHISNSDIYSCVQGLLLSGGISANQLESGWGPILFKTKVTNNEQGTRMHGVLGQEIMLFEATDFDLNNYGIEVENWANIQTQIISTILLSENVSMSNNRNYGLYIKIGSPTVVDVRGSMFVGNRNGGVYWYQYYTNNPRQAFTITDTLFEDTNFGISYTCNYCRTSNMTVTIASNTFNDNKRDIYITFHSSEQSFIVQNVFSKSQEVLAIQSDTSMETNISVIISENSFVNLLRGYTAVSVSFVKTIISKNSFNNCSSTTLISVKNGFDHLIANNTFVNSTDSICYVQTKQPYTKGKTISASLNYWDTNDIFAVKSKVCDFFVDSSTAIIDVKGFYEDFSMKKLNYSKAIDMFRSAINETTNITYIGGIVDDDIDISTLGVSRFMLNRSLLIQEGVTVRIQGVTLNITDVKGIVVLGTLVIGSSDSVDRTVIQKHSGVWNSIVLYNTGLNVLNTNISGAVAAIDIRSSSSVYIHNCTAYDGAMQSLIKADKPKHNVSVHISNCIVSVDANVIEIVVNDSQSIDVNIENSTMTSNRNYIVSVTDGSSNRSPKLVRVSVLGSHSYGGVGVLNIRGCFFRTELTIVDSEFAATRYGTLVSLANPSMKTEAHRNKFGDSRRDFYLEFCKPLTDVMNNSTTFNMVNNIFKSQSDGEVFYMYDYSGATEHTFNFTNNSMVYMQPTARQFLFITSYGNSEKHTLNFISNTLVNSSKTLLEIHHRFRQITLKWNKFINNSACLLYSAPPHTDKFLGFEIDRNEFQGNTHIDGIIVISTEQFQNGTVSLTNNDFINNMGTSFSFKTSNVSIKYNYFENPEALYNLKVNKFVTLTNVRTDINASFNYWGTTDPRDIENKLYDKSYDETLLDILYRPYLGSRNISDFRNEEINFVNGNEIGGNVNGDVTLHSDKGPYVVVSNIVVGENDTLTIQEGVEIRVMADIGFTVLVKGHRKDR
ncbi:uncharacterized protein LOC127876624 [Dreissena polymorpha]|uniref:uncharacterized protein LOC127876624 n=1 Tax=Dreissena polymorpha TaxID=45954 RepID=UPI002263B1CC|nr:uncharacterized protein LOC127876624 [Dreissena polymorpha]